MKGCEKHNFSFIVKRLVKWLKPCKEQTPSPPLLLMFPSGNLFLAPLSQRQLSIFFIAAMTKSEQTEWMWVYSVCRFKMETWKIETVPGSQLLQNLVTKDTTFREKVMFCGSNLNTDTLIMLAIMCSGKSFFIILLSFHKLPSAKWFGLLIILCGLIISRIVLLLDALENIVFFFREKYKE